MCNDWFCNVSPGKNSAEPPSRWKRALVAALVFGTVAAAGGPFGSLCVCVCVCDACGIDAPRH